MNQLATVFDWEIYEEKQKLDLLPEKEQADQQEIIDHIGSTIAEEIANPYAITNTAIEQYQTDILPYLIPRGEGAYESEAIYAETMSYSTKWLNGGLDAQSLAARMDEFLEMAISEEQ